MAHVIEDFNSNPNHPCYGMSCNECETCIFDRDIFADDKPKKENMYLNESCHLCGNLIKNYIGEDRLRFNACCGRSLIGFNSYSRPRVIKAATGPMVPLPPPEWCPKKRGVTKEYITSTEAEQDLVRKCLPAPSTATQNIVQNRPMTYSERREKLMALPKRLEWDEIEEGGVYVIPKILSQARKVVRVVMKTDDILRCSEIDEFGKESQVLTSVYPRDIDVVFITKVLKY